MENRPIAEALLARLQERMRHAQIRGKSDALCLFDVGYLIESLKQTEWGWKPSSSVHALDGYGLIVEAIKLRGRDPEMELAAAIVTCGEGPTWYRSRQQEHVRAALAGATEGSLLARNIALRAEHLHLTGSTLAELRASAPARP